MPHLTLGALGRGIRRLAHHGDIHVADLDQEARNAPFCSAQEKFHTVVLLRGVGNVSAAA